MQTYLNVHRDYNNRALSTISSARFAGSGPRCAGCIWNIAFDIWIGNDFSHELMIWTENWNQRPAGDMIGTTTIGGKQYQVWRSGSGDGGILTYVSVTPQLSGTMPLAAFFADVRARGWTPTTTWQVDYGVEVVDTNGTIAAVHLHRLPHQRLDALPRWPRWESGAIQVRACRVVEIG